MTAEPNISNPSMLFLTRELRSNPSVKFSDLAIKAQAEGVQINPVLYGRAKVLLHLVPTRPWGSNRKPAAGILDATKATLLAERTRLETELARVNAILRAFETLPH